MKILKQVAIIFGICLLGQMAAELIPVPFPGSVMSMVFLFILFLLNWLKPHKLSEVNGFLLENMAFFFIPSGVGIITQYEVIKHSVVQILIICVVSTVVTFAVTAYTVKLVMGIQSRVRSKRGGAEQ
ncbi:MAG: CidA/LrgA family protein [Clostridiales bacterium]|nr:CidA/LrgA family protein [Clostridiales bacterium]